MKTPGFASRQVRQACEAAVFAAMSVLAAGAASASMHFPELRGVPEHLGAHSLAVDQDLCWATLLLLAVVVTLWAFHRRDRRKD